MPHEISIVEKADGTVLEEAYTAGDGTEANLPWHGLGQNVAEAKSSEEAIKLSHLNWPVELRPSAVQIDGQIVESEVNETLDDDGTVLKSQHEFYSVVRWAGDRWKMLGQVGDQYVPVQNWEAFDFLDSLVADGKLLYESAGALRGGKRVWLLARLPEVDYVTPDDPMKRYLLLSNAHDGSQAIRVLTTSVRVVCNNTLTAALSNNDGVKIRHTGDIRKKIEAARAVLASVSDEFKRVLTVEQALAQTKISFQQFLEFLEIIEPCPVDSDGEKLTEGKGFTQWENRINSIKELLDDPKQQIVGGTAWAGFNAYTQFVDHSGRIRTTAKNPASEARMNNVIFEGGAAKKRKAFAVAAKLFANIDIKKV